MRFRVVISLVAVALALVGLSHGDTWNPPGEVLAALTGSGDLSVVVLEWRLPRVLAALIFGAALGVSGALFQNLTRNSLGSPDVIGLDSGAYTGALIAITVFGGGAAALQLSSVVGGLLAAAVVYLLAARSGLDGMRLIVIGIAVNAMLVATNSWIVLRAELDVAIAATGWSAGTLNGLDWDEVALPFAVLAVLAVLVAVITPAVHQAALGDDLALASGVQLGRLRLLMVLAGVCATATVTAVAGPIVFVALAAPQIGRRLARRPGIPLLPAALTGAVLLLGSDLVAQLLLSPVSLPVGVVTTAIGGAYLIWLLILQVRRGGLVAG
ncbi:iron chelate uptake ABC transporter family permease subunit [Actinoplanes sp. NPDC024001]|uniref:FecCD family ABC transporter permease n=1 Tax=Actinoplanes sp. NPDC024001 TaxID=3154598 RepID=UPI0033D0E6D6